MEQFTMIDVEASGKMILHRMYVRGKIPDDVAKALDVSPHSVYQWIKGKQLPTLDQLFTLSRYLGCEMDDLVTSGDD